MKAAFHYIVKAKIIRITEGSELDFSEINKTFENENPIIARDEAFQFYQSWIDVLLQSKDKDYLSDRQARKDLISFIDPGKTTKLRVDEKEIEFNNDSIGNGIGVYFVADQNVGNGVFNFGLVESGDEVLIHGIGNLDMKGYMIDHFICFLQSEFDYYKYFNYDTKNKEINVVYCMKMAWLDGCGDSATNTCRILETPFEWAGYDKPYWWGEPDEEPAIIQDETISRNYEDLIKGGENNTVEFKPTLLFNFKTQKAGISIKEIIAKTICAFLNSNGGFLFIGVDDDGKIQGLDYDYQLSNGKKPKDFFQLEFDQMIEHFIGFSIKSNIEGQFYRAEGKDIFIVTVSPSKNRPVFLKSQNEKKFYVRGEASSRQIIDVEEIIKYCLSRFGI